MFFFSFFSFFFSVFGLIEYEERVYEENERCKKTNTNINSSNKNSDNNGNLDHQIPLDLPPGGLLTLIPVLFNLSSSTCSPVNLKPESC